MIWDEGKELDKDTSELSSLEKSINSWEIEETKQIISEESVQNIAKIEARQNKAKDIKPKSTDTDKMKKDIKLSKHVSSN